MNRSESDDGYNSPEGEISPLKPVGCEPDRTFERLIARETRDFKAKYFIEKVILNSANGIIYQGQYEFTNTTNDYSIGNRKSDGLPICAKQVPKAKIANWDQLDGRRVPREFKLHLLASKIDGIVKVRPYLQRDI